MEGAMASKYFTCAANRPKYHLHCTADGCKGKENGGACPNEECLADIDWIKTEIRDCEFHIKEFMAFVEQAGGAQFAEEKKPAEPSRPLQLVPRKDTAA
jgi:hypothetical protein